MLHTFDLRVYYEDTDAGGIVYHANYLCFAERARTEFLHKLGLSNHKMLSEDIGIVVSHLEIDYKQPAFLEDKLTVETSVLKMGAATMLLKQDIKRDGILIAGLKVSVAFVCMSAKRPIRIPQELRSKFETYQE
ncbi:MAG: tol-pal system-associated acyl-CoA thioesterase [Alphaproteobacteria bacterium]|nr:tol-pal system-associated acyl-CoA thioesterase [Alphaproteobacteria bacterium]